MPGRRGQRRQRPLRGRGRKRSLARRSEQRQGATWRAPRAPSRGRWARTFSPRAATWTSARKRPVHAHLCTSARVHARTHVGASNGADACIHARCRPMAGPRASGRGGPAPSGHPASLGTQDIGPVPKGLPCAPRPAPVSLIKHLTAMPNNSFCWVFFLMSLCDYEARMKGFGGPPRERKSTNQGGRKSEPRAPRWEPAPPLAVHAVASEAF